MATSANDLALVSCETMREPLFAATRQAAIPCYPPIPASSSPTPTGPCRTTPVAIAGKSGFTDGARHSLVVAAQRGGHRLLSVLVRRAQRPEPM
jgi:D-alanyl-D-alanine carboxypeptidase (penicillin-binding protein 5/6)